MKIVIMPSWYENFENKQLGSFFREHAEALQKKNNEVTVLVAHILNWPYKRVKQWYKINEYNKNEVKVIYTYVPTFGLSSTSPLFFAMFNFHYLRLFKYFLKENRADIILAHSFWPAGYAAIKIKDKYKIPVVIQEHRSGVVNGLLPTSSWRYLKKAVEKADIFWAVSSNLKNVIEKRIEISNKIQIMPNMVNSIFCKKEKKKDYNKFVFLSVGNLIKRKRMDFLIDVFMETQLENSELWIVGEGSEKEKLLKIIKDNSRESNIKILGKKTREEVADLMNRSDAFVMVSECETFGVVYIEALAMGLPVIATRNGGADDIVNKSNGILIDVDNKEELKRALNEMKNNYARYTPSIISKMCWDKYSSEVLINKQMNVFNNLIENNRNDEN